MEKTATFIIYQDFDGRYRWRLRSGEGTTVASGLRGHREKAGCAREIERRNLEAGDALVRDATVWDSGKKPLARWLASQDPLETVPGDGHRAAGG